MDHSLLYIALACTFGLFMTWGVGANDLANVLSTAMGSKSITVRQALWIAIVFEIAGAFFGGGAVSKTLRHDIINLDILASAGDPTILIHGMLAVLMAGMTWMALASYFGFPVSITNAIVGSIVGFGLLVLGPNAIHWQEVAFIAASWVGSPLIASIVAFSLFRSIQLLIFDQRNPLHHARLYMSIYFFLVGLVLSYITVFKALAHFNIDLKGHIDVVIAIGFGLAAVVIGYFSSVNLRISDTEKVKRRAAFDRVEQLFAVLMSLTACAMVFAHGANDVSVAVGPLTVIVGMIQHGNLNSLVDGFPAWITLLGCGGVLVGLASYGWKVIETVGEGITALTPSRAFAATIAASGTVVVSTSIGLPVSTTQTLVGAVLGVGLARGIGALNMVVVRNIFMSWVITLPAASLLTIGFYFLLHYLC